MDTTPKRYVHINVSKHPTHHLTDEEKANPRLVLHNLFDQITLTELRKRLWRWFGCTIKGNYPVDSTADEREDILYVYEWMQKIIDVCHLLNEHEKLKSPYNNYQYIVEEVRKMQEELEEEEERRDEKDEWEDDARA